MAAAISVIQEFYTRVTLPCLGVVLRANRSIGSGHLMRVKPLLPLLREHFYLHLYVYAFDENLRSMTQDYDAVSVYASKEDVLEHLIHLPRRSGENKESKTKQENLSLGADFTEYLPKVVLIDDYAIDKSFEAPLYELTKVMVIDGLYDREHTCHKILDITLFPEESISKYRKLCNKECKILAGKQYSLTAQRFAPAFFDPSKQRCRCPAHFGGYSGRVQLTKGLRSTCLCQDYQACPVPRVFISFGGADPVSASLMLTKTILEAKLYEAYCFTMVAGMSNTDYPEIERLLKDKLPSRYQDNFVLVKQCQDIADLLFRNDLAIGAYGGMTFERVTAQIPTLGVVIADNQLGFRDICTKFNFGLSLELSELSDATKVKATLSQLLDHSSTFTHNCGQVYDGHGLEHIAAEIIGLLEE